MKTTDLNLETCLLRREPRFDSRNSTVVFNTELKYFTISFTSLRVSKSQSSTTSANSFCSIAGKWIFWMINSPRILLFTDPSATRPCFSHSLTAQRSTALNNSISLIFSNSLATNSSSTDLWIASKPSDFTAPSVSFSITFQQWCNKSTSSYFCASGNTLNTFEASRLSLR